MKKVAATAALAAALVVGGAGPASALWCQVADKPAEAGAQTSRPTTNAGGQPVFKGAFLQVDEETSFFIRGGEKGFTADMGKQFGYIPHTAECNGPEDHGVIDPWGVVCDEGGEH